MKRNIVIQRHVCECCGQEFYSDINTTYCPDCEEHWNHDNMDS